jgi:hypothetical protein
MQQYHLKLPIPAAQTAAATHQAANSQHALVVD